LQPEKNPWEEQTPTFEVITNTVSVGESSPQNDFLEIPSFPLVESCLSNSRELSEAQVLHDRPNTLPSYSSLSRPEGKRAVR